VNRAAPRNAKPQVVRCQAEQQSAAAPPPPALARRTLLSAGLALGAASAVQPSLPAHANRVLSSEWEVVELPIEKDILLLDIAFTGSDPNHGGRRSKLRLQGACPSELSGHV
jgi:hypothetical protein